MWRTDVTRSGRAVTAANLIVYSGDHIAAQVAPTRTHTHTRLGEVNCRKLA